MLGLLFLPFCTRGVAYDFRLGPILAQLFKAREHFDLFHELRGLGVHELIQNVIDLLEGRLSHVFSRFAAGVGQAQLSKEIFLIHFNLIK